MSNLSYSNLIAKSWPIILASASAPLLGLVDTAIIGNTGDTSQLAGLAIATLVFNFIFWSFGFLRMSTTGFTAQYIGARKNQQLWLLLCRGLGLSLALALAIILLQQLLKTGAITLLEPPRETIFSFSQYFSIRIYSSPATLAIYVLSGILIGMGLSRHLLAVHLFLNINNIALNIFFAGVLNWGITGIAFGTLIAEYACLLFALYIVLRALPKADVGIVVIIKKSADKHEILALLSVNTDIFIRTLALLAGFSWFTHISGSFGAEILAANYILLQFISFSAFFLDGYAHVLESLVGNAMGKKSLPSLSLAVKRTSILAGATAAALAATALILGEHMIVLLTDLPTVTRYASAFLPFTAIYILLSCAAFQLDGIFIGATMSTAMRNASIASTLVFIAAWSTPLHNLNNQGLWMTFILFVVIRAMALAYYYPKVKQRCRAGNGPAQSRK